MAAEGIGALHIFQRRVGTLDPGLVTVSPLDLHAFLGEQPLLIGHEFRQPLEGRCSFKNEFLHDGSSRDRWFGRVRCKADGRVFPFPEPKEIKITGRTSLFGVIQFTHRAGQACYLSLISAGVGPPCRAKTRSVIRCDVGTSLPFCLARRSPGRCRRARSNLPAFAALEFWKPFQPNSTRPMSTASEKGCASADMWKAKTSPSITG